MKPDISLKKRDRERFEFIETRLLWGEGLTAAELGEAFDISRPVAHGTITAYRKRHPHQMRYQASRKRHMASESFEPVYIRKEPLKFLDYLRGDTLIGHYREERGWSDFQVTDVTRLLHPELNFSAIKTVLSALHRKQTVVIEYKKKALEIDEWNRRIISPNHLVYADNRYHIRAYCYLKKWFLDFALSRIRYAEVAHEDWVPSDEDREWNEMVNLAFIPNPELPDGVQNAITQTYKMVESKRRIVSCRKALAFYVERSLLAIDRKYGKPLWMKWVPEAE